MIADMRLHYDLYQTALADRAIATAKAELREARDAAKDAAPYTHPRLAAVEHMGILARTCVYDPVNHLIGYFPIIYRDR